MISYDIEYYYNLLRIHSATAEYINNVRWDFLQKHLLLTKNIVSTILDYGCGVGWFAALRPKGLPIKMYTYDVMPVPQTGIPEDAEFDVITLWDVLEHIPDFTSLAPLLKKTNYVVISLPIKPNDVAWKDYYHLKPGEHLHYYDIELLVELFRRYGFDLKISDQPECPPRKMIWDMIFQKKELSDIKDV